jgi:hypothetical protein
MIIAFHLLFTGYGHWLPNDLRGSGSTEIRKEELEELGDIHFGRRTDQPSRQDLRGFSKAANPLLDFQPFWFDADKRRALAEAIAKVAREQGYTIWACAICSNHVHLVVKRGKHTGEAMWRTFADGMSNSLRVFADVGMNHPVCASRPYVVFLFAPDEVRGRIVYVEQNPTKEGLAAQKYEFVEPYRY